MTDEEAKEIGTPDKQTILRVIYFYMSYCLVNGNLDFDSEKITDYIQARWDEEILNHGQEED